MVMPINSVDQTIKKTNINHLKKFIIDNHHLSADEKINIFRQNFYKWKRYLEQIDDVYLCSIKFKVN